MTIRSFSYGGGTQSTAALVLAAAGKIDFPLFLFANVGEDSENPATLEYVERFAAPYAEANGIELVEVRKRNRAGEAETILERIDRLPRSVPIPVRMAPGGAPGNRTCTAEFKIRAIEKELRRRGATKDDPAIVGIGISTDEIERVGAAVDPRTPYQLREYPLIDERVNRASAQGIITAAGLPVPPRSACYFCPFHRDEEWRRLSREHPDLFEKACALEERLHERGQKLGRGEFYFTRHGHFLRDLFHGNELTLFEDGPLDAGCDSGYCFT